MSNSHINKPKSGVMGGGGGIGSHPLIHHNNMETTDMSEYLKCSLPAHITLAISFPFRHNGCFTDNQASSMHLQVRGGTIRL